MEKNPESGLVVQMDDPYESRQRRLSHNSSPPPASSSQKWIVLLIGLLLLLGGVVAAALLYKSKGDANTSEAIVAHNRDPLEETTYPATIPLPSEELVPEEIVAEIEPAEEESRFYPVAIRVTPSNATIELDGEIVAQGSYSARFELNGHVHRARFYAEGYEEQTLTFEDQSPPTSLTLAPIAKSERTPKRDRDRDRGDAKTKKKARSERSDSGLSEPDAVAKPESKPEPKAESKPEPKAESKPEPKAESKPERDKQDSKRDSDKHDTTTAPTDNVNPWK